MDIQTGNPSLIYLIAFSILAIALATGNVIIKRRQLRRFASKQQMDRLFPEHSSRNKVFSSLLLATSIALLAIALMDIRWGKTSREVPQKGIEVVFALDVSRSMLAQDATPNRLERAKQQIKDMLSEMSGDRVALIVFAGEADQAVPLTSHYEDFKQELESVGPYSVRVGGSALGVAIDAASNAFLSKTNDHRTIILFTDGEDQESKPVELARKLHEENGTRVFTVGLGDLEQGSRIPDEQSQQSQFVEHEGQQVWSKLNGRILQEIATESNGAYIPAGTKRVNMSDVYHRYIANIEQTEFETATVDAYIPRFQWFAGAALILMLLEAFLSSRNWNRHTKPNKSKRNLRLNAATGFMLACLLVPNQVQAQETSVAAQINQANELVRSAKYAEAIENFQKINVDEIHRDQLNYNLAVALYRNNNIGEAKTLFEEASRSLTDSIAADSRFNLGNCHFAAGVEQSKSDREAALVELQRAISLYRSSLRINRDQTDARANIELAAKLIRNLKRQDEQEQQQQKKQKDQNNQDQKDQNQDDQNQKDQTQQNQEQGSSDSKDNNPEPNKDEQNSGKNGNSENQNQGSESEQQQDESRSKGKEAENKNETSSDSKQGQPSDSDSQGDPSQRQQQDSSEGKEDSEPPVSDPSDQDTDGNEKSKGELSSAGQQNGDPKNQPGQMHPTDKEGVLTMQEALKMLQAVRDRDMIRRLRQQRYQQKRRVPVEKDW